MHKIHLKSHREKFSSGLAPDEQTDKNPFFVNNQSDNL